MNHSEYEILFHSLKENLYISDLVTAPIEFLHQLTCQPFVKGEIYDCMSKVFEIFFETSSEFFKEKSCQIILQFLRAYPVDEALLLKYMTDLVKNIEHFDSETRALICEFISRIIEIHGIKLFEEYVG